VKILNPKRQEPVLLSAIEWEKSVVIRVERKVRHKLYGKYVKTSVKYLADDPENQCNIGDTVLIEECRPLSKRKRWRVKQILEQAV
jgi:small subunit ribosomal protein S17